MSEWNEDDPDLGQKTEAEEPQNNIDIAQEDTFYGNQQIYNSLLDDYEKDMNCEYISEEEREYAKQQYDEVYIEKRDAIDKWKEKYGQYDEERTELRIGENKSEELKEQESYDIEEQVLEGGFQESQTADIEIAEQEAEAQRQAEVEAEERAALEADVQAQADALNKEYIDLMDRKQAAFDSTVDATNIEDRDRFANIQREIGEEMEQVRSKIIENNNRLK